MHRFAALSKGNRPPLLLAPLASLGHRGLRELIEAHGSCDLYFTEMISADALLSGSNYESYYLDAGPDPSRVIYQLVGADATNLERATAALLDHAARTEAASGAPGCAGIDLNMGCSAPEMVRQGAGVHWMTQADAARRLVAAIRALVPADRSLSAKIRIGEEADFPALVNFCRGLEAEGLDFITFHPRLRKDPWSRPARWSWFRQLSDELRLPLVANGDIRESRGLGELHEAWTTHPSGSETTREWPAGIMVGRAAVRSPWIFRSLAATLAGQGAGAVESAPREIDLLETARRFHELLEMWQPQDFWLTRAKRFHAYYGQNLVYGHRVAANIQNLRSYDQILPLFAAYLEENPGERRIRE